MKEYNSLSEEESKELEIRFKTEYEKKLVKMDEELEELSKFFKKRQEDKYKK